MSELDWPQKDLDASRRREGYHKAALICKRGHVLNSGLSPEKLNEIQPSKCSSCGARVLSKCPKCSFRLKGTYFSPAVIDFQIFEPNNFCDNCGSAMPWATRQERIWEIQNLLEEENLSAEESLRLNEYLEQLVNVDLEKSDEVKLWLKVKEIVGAAFDNPSIQSIVSDVASSYVKAKMGIN